MTTNNSDSLDKDSQGTPEKETALSDETISTKTSATTSDIPAFGWSEYAERVNGRFAMLGFAAVLLIEALSHSSFLQWAGLMQ